MRFRVLCVPVILIAAALRVNAEPAIWVVRQNDATVYLIGTVHLLRHQDDWDKNRLEKVLAESRELWLEVADFDDPAAALSLLEKYGFDQDKPLSSKLDPKQKDKLNKAAAQFGISASILEPMQPWMAALMFAELPLAKAGYDPKAGIDLLLKTEAGKRNEPVRGFETAEEQVRYIAELPLEDQLAFLDTAMEDADEGIAKLDKLAAAWINGDVKTIDGLIVQEIKSKIPIVYRKLVVERNIRWSAKIVELLKNPGIKLVAVGAGHLVGPDSVQAQLLKLGIKAEQF